jgi:hypothetical protein
MTVAARKSTLRDCADIRAGHPFRGPIAATSGGAALVVQMRDADPVDGIRWSDAVRADLPGRKTPEWLRPSDLLFVPRGQRFFAVCLDAPPGPAVCGPHLFHLRVRAGARVLPAFLAWQINQPPVQRQLRSAAEGSNQLSIRRGEIEALEIAIPPIARQHRIVALVEAAARERQLLRRLIDNRDRELAALACALARTAHPNTP